MHKGRRQINLVLGLLSGVAMALMVCAYAIVLLLFRGNEPFERLGTSFSEVMALYLVGGVVGGLLFGLLFPLTTWRWGAVLIGVVVAVPVYLGASLLLETQWAGSWLIPAVAVGGTVGYGLWSPVSEQAS